MSWNDYCNDCGERNRDCICRLEDFIKPQLHKPDVSGSLPSQELISMLKECRDMLVMCTLIDKSGQCQELVDKVDTKMGWL